MKHSMLESFSVIEFIVLWIAIALLISIFWLFLQSHNSPGQYDAVPVKGSYASI